ncbi:MAG: efflux RND transporter permease subunit [Gammaproteobacteria bacterium]
MSAPPRPTRGGGLSAWSIRHPVGVSMLTLAVVVLGLVFSLRLPIDLLPNIVYPEVRVRVLDPGVPARIMEDQVTRRLEEQLAITENVVSLISTSKEGEGSVDMLFPYGTDIDAALRDASDRLDRARRDLPASIEPPIIYKSDPQQIPVVEFIVSADDLDPVQLRSWVEYELARWFINLPGVAAAEVGGGLVREIQVLPDLERLAASGLTAEDLAARLRAANRDVAAGRLYAGAREYSSRTAGRFEQVEDIRRLPILIPGGGSLPLSELAEVRDTHADERLRMRFNGHAGVKLTLQKQPAANAVAVVDAVLERLTWLRDNRQLPAGIAIDTVSDQSVYVRYALNNALLAGLSGATLAMAVVFLFLGDLRRTLVIGTAIPVAIAVTLFLMEFAGLTLNIMSLGGLAVGIGMLVDSAIVMLENIHRHQQAGEEPAEAGLAAAGEVNSAIVAATSTNLAAVLPFLLISGLSGLLFRELIITVSAAIVAALLVALTLVPAWGTRLPGPRRSGAWRRGFDRRMERLQHGYARVLERLGAQRGAQALCALGFAGLLGASAPGFLNGQQIFLPELDEGRVIVRVTGDTGTALETMDAVARRLEALFERQPEVASVFTTTGGFVFGRTERELSSRATLQVQLKPLAQRAVTSEDWITHMHQEIAGLELVGYKLTLRSRGMRGLRVGSGEDSIALRVQGPDIETLNNLGRQVAAALEELPELRNVSWTDEEARQELTVTVDRERAAQLGLSVEAVGTALRFALNGELAGDYLDGDRRFDIRLRLPRPSLKTLSDLENTLLFAPERGRPAIRLSDLGQIRLTAAPGMILRYQQQRMVEVYASLAGDRALNEVMQAVQQRLAEFDIPAGYQVYDIGAFTALQEGRRSAGLLLGLALFLVFVVMAVQYESLRNPLVILVSVPFALTGPALLLPLTGVPLSMPVWLGLIMLAGIVVNNAIVLVEYIELLRARGLDARAAIAHAGALRLRPILMTTLTTVVGLLPLSLGLGEGAEMLQPLAQTMIYGLSFSLLVSLFLVPVTYLWFQAARAPAHPGDTP